MLRSRVDALLTGEYQLFDYDDHGCRFRVESTPVSLTVAPFDKCDEGYFVWNLEPIPLSRMVAIAKFFETIAMRYHTEVLVRVYYDPVEKNFISHVPHQYVTGSSVQCDESIFLDKYPVMDIHSHCHYDAFFSMVDDHDELSNRIYGVIGNFGEGREPHMIFRAGTGGKWVKIDHSQFAQKTEENDSEFMHAVKVHYDELMSQIGSVVVQIY